MLQRLANPYLLLTLAALFWSSNMVIGRAIRGDIPPFTLAFGRWVVAGLIVLPLALPQVKAQWPQLKAGWRPLLILGLLGIAGYNTFAYLGLQHTTATNAALLNAFVPIATIAISWAFLGKRLKPLEAAGVLISLGGALTIVARGELQVLARLDLNIGDLWMLLAVLDWALYTIALAWRPAGLHSMLMLGATIGIGIAALAPACAWELAHGARPNVSPGTLATVAYLGIVPGVFSYIFYNRGVVEVGANRASLFIHLMPVFGTLLSSLFLGEVAQAYHYLGIALIFGGIGLTMAR
ncbi:MAG: DMT family transporter [Zoogloea sp.]|nr:DMT family transporter [Zoogloea sp.]